MKLLKGRRPRAKATWFSGLLCEVAALLMVAGALSPAVAHNDGNDGPIEVVEPGRVYSGNLTTS